MGTSKHKAKMSAEEYLKSEKAREFRHEFVNDEIYRIGDTSANHNLLCGSLLVKLDSSIDENKYEVFGISFKLKANESTFYYPDVFVTSDKSTKSHYYRKEPVLVSEVLCPLTERIDRNEKLETYKNIPSLLEYLIVSQTEMHIELHRRQLDGTWLTHFYNKSDHDEIIEFQSVGMEITLDEIYRRVKFE